MAGRGGWRRLTVSRASSPLPIRVTLNPSILRTVAQLSRRVRSSSITRMRMLDLTSAGMERGSLAGFSPSEAEADDWATELAILQLLMDYARTGDLGGLAAGKSQGAVCGARQRQIYCKTHQTVC